MRGRGRSAGFTLLELMVVACILAIIVIALYTLWDAAFGCYGTTCAQTNVNQELLKSLDAMTAEIQEAAQHTVTDVPPGDTWQNSLTFRKVVGVDYGRATYSPDTITYSLGGAGGNQLLRTSGSEQRVVANGVIAFQVRRPSLSPSVVEITVEVEEDPVTGTTVQSSLRFKIKMRN